MIDNLQKFCHQLRIAAWSLQPDNINNGVQLDGIQKSTKKNKKQTKKRVMLFLQDSKIVDTYSLHRQRILAKFKVRDSRSEVSWLVEQICRSFDWVKVRHFKKGKKPYDIFFSIWEERKKSWHLRQGL